MMRPGDILGRIFFMLSQKSIIGSSGFIHGAHGGHGFFLSTEHTDDTDILGSLRLEIFGGNLL